MTDPIDITDIGWQWFGRDNHGEFVLYILRNPNNGEIARVTMPIIPDGPQRFINSKIHWAIERYEYDLGGTDFKIDDEYLGKEDFIATLSEKYPDDLAWLLFHPQWLE